MRTLLYATTIALAVLIGQIAALPVETNLVEPKPVEIKPNLGMLKEETDHKYFHEPGNNDILGHYDVRYYHGVVSYDERTDTLRHMIRAYLQFFRAEGIETWIAHGTLLGWWWNGMLLPWDWDVDVQVSGATLAHLATHYNRTLHDYTSPSLAGPRSYLLDINPWSRERERGDGQNIIDARWIDTRNGLYIDITGLSETHPDLAPGVVSCKNYHRYRMEDLYPLRESLYEGVPALIPNDYVKILTDEYQEKALVEKEYEG
ncbi:hypothetical protein W97_00966 [Coniosporium apollinis CBS 100218]|uniref:LicD/FKTN/FKRP nucleotidyltransferase domain-containing protein n=1 Tax=Coniosporium apollinis (strain CBS 100218) TaxID=1168221 RepID=R7YIL1_CONA1|nr:uncharacterized protein W97_00966 [Coniosporium apollinis CBS 100218]EON61750.1 hypothetical protein W97_00966 [Coniosporium apollinis CBS 100218]